MHWIVLLLILPASAGAQIVLPTSPTKTKIYTEEELRLLTPRTSNPYLSVFAAGAEPDWDYWRSEMQVQSGQKSAVDAFAPQPKVVSFGETEGNNTQGAANFVAGFGTGAGDDPALDISGTIFATVGTLTNLGTISEAPDDGRIDDGTACVPAGTAAPNVLTIASGDAVTFDAVIGDGLWGSIGVGLGDFDFYKVNVAAVPALLTVDIDTTALPGLDSIIIIYDATGNPLAFNDDEDPTNTDSFIAFDVPATGDYFIMIGGFSTFSNIAPTDVLCDPGSGPGVGSEGNYNATIGIDVMDVDYFEFDLEAGDVLGAVGTTRGNVLSFYDPGGVLRITSSQDLSGLYPLSSPLPTAGGNGGVFSYVVEAAGTYAVRVISSPSSTGAYALQLRVFRPPLDFAGIGERQTLFIDFDGEAVDRSVFGSFGIATLSPMSSFLASWGLSGADESAVIDAILATVTENLQTDIALSGLNINFDIQITNSRDDPDVFISNNVSRVVVGGTIAELGLGPGIISLAQSVDPGNFAAEETAIVLLDTLSDGAANLSSLNSITLGGGVTTIELVGIGVGNFVSHEAGHIFGNFHTENQTSPGDIMDTGGNLPVFIGQVGGIFGDGDDLDVDFAVDAYEPQEFFIGQQDGLNVLSFDLSSNPTLGPVPLRAWPVLLALLFSALWLLRRRPRRGEH